MQIKSLIKIKEEYYNKNRGHWIPIFCWIPRNINRIWVWLEFIEVNYAVYTIGMNKIVFSTKYRLLTKANK